MWLIARDTLKLKNSLYSLFEIPALIGNLNDEAGTDVPASYHIFQVFRAYLFDSCEQDRDLVTGQLGIDDYISICWQVYWTQGHAGKWCTIRQANGNRVGTSTQGGIHDITILEVRNCQAAIDVNIYWKCLSQTQVSSIDAVANPDVEGTITDFCFQGF